MKENVRSKKITVDFIGIGAGRSGTTWILDALQEHPQIWFPRPRELNYFSSPRSDNSSSEYEKRGIKHYVTFFKDCPKNKIKGESSTHYMPDQKTAKIIKRYFPNIKIWAILRNPVERAFSDYIRGREFHLKEDKDFETAFFAKRNSLYKSGDGYRERGYYYKHLKEYFKHFPKENIKIMLYDDFERDNEKVIKGLYKFLEVDDKFKPSILNKRINKRTGTKFKYLKKIVSLLAVINYRLERSSLGNVVYSFKKKTRISEFFNKLNEKNTKKDAEKDILDKRIYEKLKREYIFDINKLEKLINRDLKSWK